MSKRPHWQEKLNDVNGWLEEFQNESDRAAAVLAVAYLEAQLENVFRGFLVDSKEVDELFGPDAPLGTFSSRRRMAYALGMLTPIQHRDLELLGRIRNKFAHRLHGLSFRSNEVFQLCDQLRTPKLFEATHFQPDVRGMFVTAVALIAMELNALASRVGEQRRVVPKEVTASTTSVSGDDTSRSREN